MPLRRTSLTTSIALIATTAAIAGCPTPNPGDGGDVVSENVGQDVVTDRGGGGDVMGDVGQDIVTPPDADATITPDASDGSMGDARADADATTSDGDGGGGACSGSVDPMQYYLYSPTVSYQELDQTPIMITARYFQAVAMPSNFTTPAPPEDMAGDCVFHMLPAAGSMSYNTAPTSNVGDMSLTQGTTFRALWHYDTTMNRYTPDLTMAMNPMPGMPMTFMVAGGDGGVGGMVTLNYPPRPTVASIHYPATIMSGHDMDIDWDVPADLPAGQVMTLLLQDSTSRQNVTLCAVPACRGTINVPARLMSHYPAASQIFVNIRYTSIADVPPPSRSLRLLLVNGVNNRMTVM